MFVIIQRRSCRGFTLLESLIAVLVLSVGLLGAASLQVLSSRSNFEAVQRTQATTIANSVLDRMRAGIDTNPRSATERQANTAVLDCFASADLTYGTTVSDCTVNVIIDASRIAQINQDRSNILTFASAADSPLVSPKICITHDGAGQVSVTVAWRGVAERTGAIADAGCTLATDAENAFLKQVVMNTYIASR